MFLSDLRGQEIIDESVSTEIALTEDGDEFGRGYIERDYAEQPVGSVEFATPFSLDLLPRSDWPGYLERQEKRGSLISKTRALYKLKSSNQGRLGYCWIHGCVNAMRLLRALHDMPYADLEATMAGALVKNYANRGGNTPEAIRHLAKIGVCTTRFWQPNSLDRSQDTPAMRANAARYKLLEWWELKSNSFAHLATCLLYGLPVVIGLSWWSHMIVAQDLVRIGADEWGVRIWNSWGDGWGDNGEKILTEGKAIAFDQMAPRLVSQTYDADDAAANPYEIAE